MGPKSVSVLLTESLTTMSAPPKKTEPMDTSLPSTRTLQVYVRDKHHVEAKLITGDLMQGIMMWLDPECFCVKEDSGQRTLVWRRSIAYVRSLGLSPESPQPQADAAE